MNNPENDILKSPKRPLRWEEDFSVNALDDLPLAANPSVASKPESEVQRRPHLITDELLADRDYRHMVAQDTFPIPDDEDREGYFPGEDFVYWLNGMADYLKVMQVVKRHAGRVDRVMDFGAASGRVARHFAAQLPDCEVWASDVNYRHVRWLSTFMPPSLKPIFNSSMPSLPIADNTLDLACAFSVFTHIDTFETSWIAEMRRIMKPGGIAYFTIHNQATWSRLSELDSSNRLINSMLGTGKFKLSDLQNPMPAERTIYRFNEIGPYRAQVFHTDEYIHRVWGRFFEIREIIPCHHQRQSVVVMVKE